MKRRQSQGGFSLIEMLVVVALLTIILGVILRQIVVVQQRGRGEEVKLDMTQQARESLDQLIRDVHQAGYPNQYMYSSGVLASPVNNNNILAVGLVKLANTSPEIQLEGDVNQDGVVESVHYRMATTSTESTHCPCIERSEVTKQNGVAPLSQATSYHVLVENVSGMQFTAYDASGATVTIPSAGLDIGTSAGATTMAGIKSIQIQVTVQGRSPDLATRQFPTTVLNGLAQIRN